MIRTLLHDIIRINPAISKYAYAGMVFHPILSATMQVILSVPPFLTAASTSD